MTLKRKLETGIVGYLKTLTATILKSYTFYEASEAKDRKLPVVMVKASGEEEAFPGGAPRNVKLEFIVITSYDDNEEGEVPNDDNRQRVRESHDEALAAIEAALEAPGVVATIQGKLNSGASKRLVEDFHFYDLTKTGEDSLNEKGLYGDSLAFTVVCQNYDG